MSVLMCACPELRTRFRPSRVNILELTLSRRRSLLYRNQSVDLLCKSLDWFLYDREPCHDRVNWKKYHYRDMGVSRERESLDIML